jgi:raffinose/stachyose/melibiose transport system permease protein
LTTIASAGRRVRTKDRAWTLVGRTIPPFLFLLPAVAVYTVFFLVPLAESVRLAFHSWNGLTKPIFVGLANFQTLLDDRLFWNALQHTAVWATIGTLIPIGVALLLAVLVEDGRVRGREFFRSLFFVPQVISIAVTAVIWSVILEPTYGLLNNVLNAVGLGGLTRIWLADPMLALPAVIFAWAWHFFAFAFVVYVAGLQSIDRSLYEAARVDGASPWRLFWQVTLPLLRRVHTAVLAFGIIASLRPFAVVWAMTQGGPYYATDVIPTVIYREGFVADNLGYAAAVSLVLAASTLVITIVFFSLRERGSY